MDGTFDLSGWINCEELPAEYDCDFERVDGDPGFYGRRRRVWTARLLNVRIGELRLSREQMVLAVGEEAVRRHEANAAQSEARAYGDAA